tara:strand:- start:795 stop:1118 length:324 start_codon:yes stop_codon:yes gene_type:complete
MPKPRSKNYSSRGEKVKRSPGLSVSMPDSLKADLILLAGNRGESVSRVVRDLIERELSGSLITSWIGHDTKVDLLAKAEDFGTTPGVLAKCLIRGGLRGMRGKTNAH